MAMIEFDKILFDEATGTWSVVNTETGETRNFPVITEVKKITSTKKTSANKKDNDPIAKLTLEDNKYSFNSAAIELMGLEPEQKIAIKYETYKKTATPVIGTTTAFGIAEASGNRLTKTFTVSCRGANNTKLSEFGHIFEIEAHPTKEGLFILKGDNPNSITEMPEEIELPDDVPFDLNTLEGIDDSDNDLDEILSSDLSL